jgi:tRNA(fMet)-specific endonuclease VapC
MIIADSDVLIDYLRLRNPAADQVTSLIQNRDLCTTAISCFEILSGTRTAHQLASARRLMADIPILQLDLESAERGAQVRRGLEERGMAIGFADSLIAGIVLTAQFPLLSRNRRHFERVEGLVVAPLQ